MHIDACTVTHHTLDGDEIFIHPVQILFLVPDIAVHLFLERAQGIVCQLRLRRTQFLRDARIPPQIDLLCVVRSARKRRVNVNEIHMPPLLAQIGARRNALAANDEVLRRIRPDALLLRQLVDGHPAPQIVGEHVLPMIAQGAPKIVQYRLPLDRLREKRDISYRHCALLCCVPTYMKNSMMRERVCCIRSASLIVSSR